MNMPLGMPGPDGSLGECQVCGESFIGVVFMGETALTGRVPGIDNELAVHHKCAERLKGTPWEELPDGPIRKAFEEAYKVDV